MKTKVLIIEDEIIIARDLQLILEKGPYEIAGIESGCDEAVEKFRSAMPDVVISDIFLHGEKGGIDAVNEILQIKAVPVIFVTAYSSDEVIERVSHLQNIFYLTKPFTTDQVLATMKIAVSRIPSGNLPRISQREKQIVDLLVRGKSSCEIAALLNISVETVKTHRKHIFSKYQVNSATQLISQIMQTGGYY